MTKKNIEAIYELSPLQEGMQFQSVFAPESKSYFQQLSCQLSGTLDLKVFKESWQMIIERHEVLRTAFVWEGLDKILQVVQKTAKLQIETENIAELSSIDQEKKISEYLRLDQAKGLDLTKSPLMRIKLFNLGESKNHLIWSHHHILLDGWSVSTLFKEVFAIYLSKLRGELLHLPEVTPYREYISWIKKQNNETALKFWKEKLSDIDYASRLSIQKEVTAKEANNQTHIEIQKVLSESETKQLQDFAKKNRLTLNTLTQAAWAYILSRYSGETNVIFGATVNGRPDELKNSENMIGLFINTLPFSLKVHPRNKISDWLQAIQKNHGEIEQFAHSSLVDIQSISNVEHGTPLFESILVFENFPLTDTQKASDLGIKIDQAHLTEQTNYPVTVIAVPGKEFVLLLSYNPALFDERTITKLLGNWAKVLLEISSNNHTYLSEIDMFSKDEESELFKIWESNEVEFDNDECIHTLFEKQADKTPNNIAIITEGEEITYEKLNGYANRLASHLIDSGICVEDRVGISMERSWKMIGAMLAIIKAGAAYVPINHELPSERIKYIYNDSSMKYILSESKIIKELPETEISIFNVDKDESVLSKYPDENPRISVKQSNQVYIIYTSGSTGEPKGVVVTHKSLVNFVLEIIKNLGLLDTDRMLQFAPLSFDASAIQIYPPILSGAAVVLNKEITSISNIELLNYCLEKEVTVLDVPSGYWHQWIEEIDSLNIELEENFRIFMTGGDRLSIGKLKQWAKLVKNNALMLSSYGPTETTVSATVFITTRDEVLNNKIGNSQIGKPLGNVQTYVIDSRWFQPAPIGVGGELLIGGHGLARNYLNSPDLTAEKFIPNPFSVMKGSRLYKTGDYVRTTEEGTLEFLGRNDQQVKIRGIRIEVGEIEVALRSHPDIKETVVLAISNNGNGQKQLVGYIKPEANSNLTLTAIRQFLKKLIPEHMIPTSFKLVDDFPLLSSGKVDRKKVPDLPQENLGSVGDIILPRNPVEESLVEIWKDILEVPKISVGESFFALGGHSLIATRLISRIKNIFQIDLSVQSLFENPTITELADVIGEHLSESDADIIPVLKRIANKPVQLPLSQNQERLWFIDKMLGENAIFNLVGIAKLKGKLDVGNLENSINAVIQRHEVLRTKFTDVKGIPKQIVLDDRDIALEIIDIGLNNDNSKLEHIEKFVTAETNTPFDLKQDNLLRAKLLKFPDNEFALILTIHHIICDGWSIGILIREITESYQKLMTQEIEKSAGLPVQYSDYVFWQKEISNTEGFKKSLNYWKTKLDGMPNYVEITPDHSRPLEQTYKGQQEIIELPEKLTTAIKKLSQIEGVTLFMLLLAAFKTLISKYSGHTDIVIGTPTAGRQDLATEKLIGFFLNTLVLRTKLSGNPDFKEILRRTKQTCLEAYKNQNVSFENLIEILKPERDRSRTPLVQIMFNMLNFEEEKVKLPDLTVEGMAPHDHWSKFDITLYASENDGKIKLNLVYNTDLYTSQTIKRILNHYQELLEKISEDNKLKINDFEIVTENEIKKLINSNQPVRVDNYHQTEDLKFEETLDQQFIKQAKLNPADKALITTETNYTYEELDKRSTAIAQVLIEANENKENKGVGLLFLHDQQMVTALLAGLKSGKYYVPLDTNNPVKRLLEIINDASVSSLLVCNKTLELAGKISIDFKKYKNADLTIINVDDIDHSANQIEYSSPNDRDSIAYILYTSGSTGKPKGVYQSHKNVSNHIKNYSKALNLDHTDRILLLASYGFDASVMDIYGALFNGSELYIYDLNSRGISNLYEFVIENEITIFHSTPTVFRTFINGLSKLDKFENVRAVVLGGEEAYQHDLNSFNKYFKKDAIFINGLGPTESTLALQYFLRNGQGIDRRTIPVGYPVDGTKVHLLTKDGKTGIWGEGEIAIESHNVALGYWNKPELSEEKFKETDPDPSTKIYFTGDIGRRLPNHSIEFIGRKDNQVKIRGQRVELGEIESKLNSLEDILNATVIVQSNNSQELNLISYLVRRSDSAISESEIRISLRKTLPEYMIPQYFVFLEELPLTLTGKVNRKGLPKIDFETKANESDYVAPRTTTEEVLQGIWEAVINQGRIGIDDDFFAIGGHSLIATQLISDIRDSFGVNIELREIFERPTIAHLAKRIYELQHNQNSKLIEITPRLNALVEPPLANAQKRLWFLDELEKGNPAYNMSMGFNVRGKLDIEALSRSIEFIIKRHEPLRTVIKTKDGNPYQQINEPSHFKLNLLDLSDKKSVDREAFAHKVLKDEVRQPFDLSIGPLFRHLLIKLADDRYMLWFTLHHIICDGWSIGILSRELSKLYMDFVSSEKNPQLPTLKIQYADFANWQEQALTGDILEYQADYWSQKLGNDLSSLKLPYDEARPNELIYKGTHKSFTIEKELVEKLTEICRKTGTTLFMFMISAWKVLFMRYSNQGEIVMGIPVAGRSQTGTESLIGMFVNTLVLRTEINSSDTFEDVLSRVKQVCLDAYAHQDLPFETLVSALQPTRDLSRVPLFEVMFNWLNFYENPEEIARSTGILSEVGLELEPLSVENSLTKFDISLILSEGENGLSGIVEYNTYLFEDLTIERLLINLNGLLEAIVDKPEMKIGSLPIVSEKENDEITSISSGKVDKFDNELLIAYELFEKQVDRTPDNTAVVFGETKLTYSELDKKANRLANYLIAKGIKNEDRIGICLDRSLEMVIAVLGVVKTGAAYVPMDSEYPQTRLKYVAEDAGMKLLLTNSKISESVLKDFSDILIPLDQIESEVVRHSDNRPKVEVKPENLFYVIYTSGSTGLPKGAMNTNSGVVNRQLWMQKEYPLDESSAVLQIASFGFDFSNWEIFGTLATGAKLILPESGSQRDSMQISALIEEQQVTDVHFVPSQLEIFLDHGDLEKCNSLKRVYSGGEELSCNLRDRLFDDLDVELINQYGPTECSIDVTYWKCSAKESRSYVPIGRPNANNKIYILNEFLDKVPIGGIGEIFIGGEAVGRGYINKPELTSERFLPDPFVTEFGQTMYRTGDVGRFANNGTIEYKGRIDNQIQLRGFRIELGEIEKVLLEMPLILRVAVNLFEQENVESKLIAYLIPEGEQHPTINELREFAQERLPYYMIPSSFVFLEEFPMTPSGKLDRDSLSELSDENMELGNEFILPTNEIEQILCNVWSEVLGLEKIGINDNFFALGGDSILSIQIVVKAKEFGLNFNPRQLFKYQTVAELAQVTNYKPQISAETGILEGIVPLSPIQIDYFERELSNPNYYNQSILMDLGNDIDSDILRSSIEFLFVQHDALRMRFSNEENVLKQSYKIVEENEVFTVYDFAELNAEDKKIEIEQVINNTQENLSIENGPLLKTVLLNLGEDEGYRLLLVAHHLIIDGVSWRVLAEHLPKIYQLLIDGKKPVLGDKTCSYRQWSKQIFDTFETEKSRDQASFWLGQKGNSQIDWQIDNPGGDNFEGDTVKVSHKLSPDDTEILLSEVPTAYDVRITDILLTAWAIAINNWSGADRSIVALEGHGRNEIEALDVTETVGWFTTVTPVLLNIENDIETWNQVKSNANTVDKCLQNGVNYRQCRYFDDKKIREYLKAEWEPLVSFNYLGQIRTSAKNSSKWKLASENFGNSKSETNQRRYDLDVVLIVVDNQLEISFAFSEQRYDLTKIESLMNNYEKALTQIIKDKDSVFNKNDEELFEIEDLDEILEEVEFEI